MPWIFNHWKQMNGEVLRVFDMQRTGAFIAMCRREQGFTQNELAQRMGVSFQAVAQMLCRAKVKLKKFLKNF